MHHKSHYGNMVEAINFFQLKGYSVDFNLAENISKFNSGEWKADHFEIKDVFRYEGDSDPADESVVYALESEDGIKGILLTSYGMCVEPELMDLINQFSC